MLSFSNQFPDHPTVVLALISDTKLTQAAAEEAFSKKGFDMGEEYIVKIWVPDSGNFRKGVWVPK